jgi:hypothetical protein
MICRCEVKYAATLQEKQGKDNNTIRLFYFVKLIRYMHCMPTGKTKIWVCYTVSAENVEKIFFEIKKSCYMQAEWKLYLFKFSQKNFKISWIHRCLLKIHISNLILAWMFYSESFLLFWSHLNNFYFHVMHRWRRSVDLKEKRIQYVQ